MKDFLCAIEINVEAENEEDAAFEAWNILYDQEAMAPVVKVTGESGDSQEHDMQALIDGKKLLLPYTVFIVQQPGTPGTTHISTHYALNEDEAMVIARREVREDWELPWNAELHILGIAAGYVKILNWDDGF